MPQIDGNKWKAKNSVKKYLEEAFLFLSRLSKIRCQCSKINICSTDAEIFFKFHERMIFSVNFMF